MKLSKGMEQIGTAAVYALAAALFAAHFLHLAADFPNFSPWMDYAKYTDEGWYGNAAIAYFIRGGWYVPGDFNPAVALPIWPLSEWVLFHFTGVSLSAARALTVVVFGGNVALTCALLRLQASRWVSLLAMIFLVSNAFLYCFSRLAILEPLLIFLMLLSWLLSLLLPRLRLPGQRGVMLVAIGLILSAMVLTKTTAVFLFPSVFYLLWFVQRKNIRGALLGSALVALAASASWLAYYLLGVRPHYLQDYRYLFTANVFPQPTTAAGWVMAFRYALHGTLWIDRDFALLSFALMLIAFSFCHALRRNPLFIGSLLAAVGYIFFIGLHNNMQPRYYQVIAFPLVIIAALVIDAVLQRKDRWGAIAAAAAAAVMAFVVITNTRQTLWFAIHPQYTFVNAAENLTRYIDLHPNRNRLLLSISGSNIALVTGLPAICDDFGTLDLPERIRRYQPGWYAAWNELDPGTLEDLHTQFNLEQVANFPAYDDEDRNDLILYKLIPLPLETPKARPPSRSHRMPLGGEAGRSGQIRRVAEAILKPH